MPFSTHIDSKARRRLVTAAQSLGLQSAEITQRLEADGTSTFLFSGSVKKGARTVQQNGVLLGTCRPQVMASLRKLAGLVPS